MRANRQDGASDGPKDFFRHGAEQHFPESGAAPSADDHEIRVAFCDGFLQPGLNVSLFDKRDRADAREHIEQLLAVLFIFLSNGFFVRPIGRLGHRIDDRGPHVQSDEIRVVAFGDSFDVRNRMRGGGRKIGSEQDVAKAYSSSGGGGFHGLCPPERILAGPLFRSRDGRHRAQ